MFDFQKLHVFTKSKDFAKEVINFLSQNKADRVVNDQLKRASLSIMLNIAEGSSRFSNKDRKNFMVIARGSAFECLAIFEFLKETNFVSEEFYQKQFQNLEEISKMLYALIKNLDSRSKT